MIIGIQIIGLIFALFMMYLTFLYHKRGNYQLLDFGVWMLIWLSFTGVVLFPDSFGGLLNPLEVASLMDLFTIVSFMVVFCILFSLYLASRRNDEKIGKMVRRLALEGGRSRE